MTHTPYDLDDVQEYFEFKLKGHVYRFRHMNSFEIEELRSLEGQDDEKTKVFLYSFITKVDSESPDFQEASKAMIVPQWAKFRQMIVSEFSGNANS